MKRTLKWNGFLWFVALILATGCNEKATSTDVPDDNPDIPEIQLTPEPGPDPEAEPEAQQDPDPEQEIVADPGQTIFPRDNNFRPSSENLPRSNPNGRSPSVPPAVQGLRVSPVILASSGQASVQVSWNAVISMQGYRIQYRFAGTQNAFGGNIPVPGDQRIFTVSNLVPAQRYEFRIIAYNAAGDSPPSNTVTVTTSQDHDFIDPIPFNH